MDFQSFDAAYVRRLREGDTAVEEHFAAYFGTLLYLKLRARLRSRQLIEDIRQETLLRVLQILRRQDGVEYPERFGAFVNAVCNNVLLEFCRAESRHEPAGEKPVDLADPTIDLDAPLVEFEKKRQVRRVLAELPAKDRHLLQAIYLDETDKSEVCRQHRVDANYLRVLLHRAKSRFRKAYLEQVKLRSAQA